MKTAMITAAILVLVVMGIALSVQSYEVKRLGREVTELKLLWSQLKKNTELESSPEMTTSNDKEMSSKETIAKPSKKPSRDVTGASARKTQRHSRDTQCKKACRMLVHCIAGGNLCPRLTTDGTDEAISLCTAACEENSKLDSRLVALTECPQEDAFTLPEVLRLPCLKSGQ